MADRIEIDTSLLAQDRDRIQEEVQSLKICIAQVQEQVEQLSDMWEGPAKEAFLNQFWSDCDFIQNFFTEMDTYTEAMEYAQKEYEKCDNDVAQIIGAIEI